MTQQTQTEDLAHRVSNYAAVVLWLNFFLIIIVAYATRGVSYAHMVLVPQVVVFICSFVVLIVSGAISDTVDDDIRAYAQAAIALLVIIACVVGCALLGNFFHQLLN